MKSKVAIFNCTFRVFLIISSVHNKFLLSCFNGNTKLLIRDCTTFSALSYFTIKIQKYKLCNRSFVNDVDVSYLA